ncbi:MAG: slipin family protein [Armatimonadetes bacterium]|nr:slipin family protein [Armatimonadota bacterium]
MWYWLLGLFIVFVSGFRIAAQWERGVVFRLGRYSSTKGPGLYWLLPLGIERQRKMDTRTVVMNVEPQETITRDSVTIKVNAVVWYLIEDPMRAACRVQDFRTSVYQLALTTLRNVIGQHFLDEVLRERDKLNELIWHDIDEATAPWGVKVERVEMKDVEIPTAMQRAMAKEAEALREKRARLIKAQAEQEAAEQLTEAAAMIAGSPGALELRRMQMLTEIGAEQNSTTIVVMPADFVTLAHNLADAVKGRMTVSETTDESGTVSADAG